MWSGRTVVAIHFVLEGIVEHQPYPNLRSSVDPHHRNQLALHDHRHQRKNIGHDLILRGAIHRCGDCEGGYLVRTGTKLCSCSGVVYSFQKREMMNGIVNKSQNVSRLLPHLCNSHYLHPYCFLIVCFYETALRTSLGSE